MFTTYAQLDQERTKICITVLHPGVNLFKKRIHVIEFTTNHTTLSVTFLSVFIYFLCHDNYVTYHDYIPTYGNIVNFTLFF